MYAEVYSDRGFAYSNKGQYDKAISDYTRAIELNPKVVRTYGNRAFAYTLKHQWDQAISDWTKAIEIDPENAEAYFNRGRTWELNRNLDKAIADYTKAVKINPRHPEAYLNRGTIWLNKGDLDQASIDFLKRALCVISDDEEFQTALASIEDQSSRKYESDQSPLFFLPFLGIKETKSEWTSEMLEVAVAGCAEGIFIHQFQAYKIQNGIADGEMTPQQTKTWTVVIFPKLENVCRCVIDKVSSKWSWEP